MITGYQPDISIVIPAFNEARRLPRFLAVVLSYAAKSAKRYQIIIVDDGSTDGTSNIVERIITNIDGVLCLRLEENQGKGCAVRMGLLKALGSVRVFLDADGSVHPSEIEKHLHYFKEGYDAVIGSRAKRSPDQVLEMRRLRVVMGAVFNFLLRAILRMPFLDTQCGFKMFRAEIVEPIFSQIHLQRFGFDIELMYVLHRCGYKAMETPISWRHVDGSKVNLGIDSVKMFVNILQVRRWHAGTVANRQTKWLVEDEYQTVGKVEDSPR